MCTYIHIYNRNLKIYVYIGYLDRVIGFSTFHMMTGAVSSRIQAVSKLYSKTHWRWSRHSWRSPFEAMLIYGALAAERSKWISWIVLEEDDLHDDDGAYNKVTRCNYKAKLSTETEAAYWKTNIVSLYSRPAVKPAITTLSRGGKCESAIVSYDRFHSSKRRETSRKPGEASIRVIEIFN